MRSALLVVACMTVVVPGCAGCKRTERFEHRPRAMVADEVLVRIPFTAAPGPPGVPGPPGAPDEFLISKLQLLFGPPHDSCCISGGQITYLFKIGEHRTVADAIKEARSLDPEHPERVWAQPNFIYVPDKTPNDPRFDQQWFLDDDKDRDINAPEAWEEVTGDSSVFVAIVDSGVRYKNPDLQNRLWTNRAECEGKADVDDDTNGYIDDCYGIDAEQAVSGSSPGPVPAGSADAVGNKHGTAVAGIAAAEADNKTLMAGVVWDARILACKFYEGDLDGTTLNAAKCLDYVREMKRMKGLNLVAVNMSWTTETDYDDLMYCAIDRLRHAGVLTVASAGNAGTDNDRRPHYPASYFLPNVIAVAETAKDTRGEEILFRPSNRGAGSVHTAAAGEVSSLGLGDVLESFHATSGSAAYVTGLLALLKAKDLQDGSEDLDWRALKNLVLAGGKRLDTLRRTTISGRRILAWGEDTNPGSDDPRTGALTCRHQPVQRRLRPLENFTDASGEDVVLAGAGRPLPLAAISIDCATPAGPVAAVAKETAGSQREFVVPLDDDDLTDNQVAGDGIFTAEWPLPSDITEFRLTYRYGANDDVNDAVTVRPTVMPTPVQSPTLVCPTTSATPTAQPTATP
jgi:hypothetical protein